MSEVKQIEEITPAAFTVGPIGSLYQSSGVKAKISGPDICLGPLTIPWEISASKYNNQGEANAKMALLMTDPKMMKFFDGLDAKCIDFVKQNKKAMKMDNKKSAIADLFQPTIKRDTEYEPLFKARMAVDPGSEAITTPCFDMKTHQPMQCGEVLQKHNQVTVVVRPLHVYSINSMLGVTFKCIRVGLNSKTEVTPYYDFGGK